MMGQTKNTAEKIKLTRKTINPRYDASYQNIMDIVRNSTGLVSAASDGFVFGYMQGMKAAKAETRVI